MDKGSSDIRRRLEALRADTERKQRRRSDPPLDPDWERLEPYVYRRRIRRPIEDASSFGCALLTGLEPEAARGFGTEDLLFFDTETTGLSSGAGSVVFLVGMCWIENGGATVEQLFLSDFPGEPGFLSYLNTRFPPERIFVSYNGKSFDSHILRSRFLMNGMSFDMPFQLDLLHPARRLWGRIIGSCSLHNLESEVLGVIREEDVPGEEVPELYFRFLRTGEPSLLRPVFSHNLQDTLSLTQLYHMIERMCSGRFMPGRVDLAGLGRLLLERGDSSGVRHLQEAFDGGDLRAGRMLGLRWKRAGRWEEAIAVWRAMAERSSLHGMVELAKYYEHREKDFEEALSWTINAERKTPFSDPALAHRRRRLENRLSRRNSSMFYSRRSR